MRRREVVRKLVVYTTNQKLVIGILTRKEKGKIRSRVFSFYLITAAAQYQNRTGFSQRQV
jgi:hypothetical protein